MMNHGRLAALTGLRFPAALAVALAHLWYVVEHPAVPSVVKKLLREGHVGVPFFFGLSGFLLAHSYRHRLQRGQVAKYLAARAARIGPLHALLLGIAILFPYVPRQPELWQNVLQLVLLHAWVPHEATFQGANPVTWTLGVEAFLYAMLPLLLAGAKRGERRPPAFWLGVALTLALVQPAVVQFVGKPLGEIGFWLFVLMPPVHLFEFAVGVALAYAWSGLRERGWADVPTSRSGRAWATAGEVGALALLVAAMLYGGKLSAHLRQSGFYTLPVGLIVLAFALGRGWLSRLMSTRPAVFLGEASFAFYLVHCLVFFHLERAAPTAVNRFLLGAISVTVAVGIAALLFVAVEAPARRWLLKSKPVPVTVAVPMRRAA